MNQWKNSAGFDIGKIHHYAAVGGAINNLSIVILISSETIFPSYS